MRPFFYTRGARLFAKNDVRVDMDFHISKCTDLFSKQYGTVVEAQIDDAEAAGSVPETG